MLLDLLSIIEEGIPARRTPKKTCLDWGLAYRGKPDFGGVYVFWWRHSVEHFLDAIQNPELHFSGPGEIQLTHRISSSNLVVADNGRLPLYVGKSASNIAKRVGLHLTLGTARSVSEEAAYGLADRRRTSCQIRDRLDRLFPSENDMRDIAIENLSLSYLRLDGEGKFVDRFYLEDLAIGELRPLFNLDSER